MVISNASAVEASIHAVSPLLILSTPITGGEVGAGGAAAGAAAASALGGSAFESAAGAAAAGAGAGAAAGAGAGAVVVGVAALSLSCADVTVDTPRAPIRMPSEAINANNCFMGFPLERIGTGLAGPDAHDLFELENEDFSVTDLAGVRGLLDCLDDTIEHVGLDRGFDFDFRKEVDDVFRATV